jgi:chromosome segregation ATPase
MDTSAIIEADVLLKMGMGDSLQQTHVLSLIHTCCTFVTEERFESISTFGRCLKRKVLETETIADEVQALRADVKSKTAELEDAKTASALLNSEIADLKAQLRAERERMQRYREEAHDLREIQKHASKTTGELNSRISALNIELASSDSKWERKHTDAKRELSNVKRANSRLLEEAATLRKTVERKSAEAKAAKEQARALNADLHRLSDEREAATSEITDRALRFQTELEQARAELAQPR